MIWTDRAPGLERIDQAARDRLAQLVPVLVQAGSTLFHPGDSAQGFVIVLSGRIDVFLTGPNGRDILLYSVEPGGTCVQTTLGLLGGTDYTGEGVAATDCTIVMVPEALFTTLMHTSQKFSAFVFMAFAGRMQDMMHLLERVAFQRIESRLAQVLLDLAVGNEVRATHQDLAMRIGSAREVVSRRLEAFTREGLVVTERGSVRLSDSDGLRRVATAGR